MGASRLFFGGEVTARKFLKLFTASHVVAAMAILSFLWAVGSLSCLIWVHSVMLQILPADHALPHSSAPNSCHSLLLTHSCVSAPSPSTRRGGDQRRYGDTQDATCAQRVTQNACLVLGDRYLGISGISRTMQSCIGI